MLAECWACVGEYQPSTQPEHSGWGAISCSGLSPEWYRTWMLILRYCWARSARWYNALKWHRCTELGIFCVIFAFCNTICENKKNSKLHMLAYWWRPGVHLWTCLSVHPFFLPPSSQILHLYCIQTSGSGFVHFQQNSCWGDTITGAENGHWGGIVTPTNR